jgi:hypothetical protein
MADELCQIGPAHGIPASQHEQRRPIAERANLVDQAEPLGGAQLARVAPRERIGAAVQAGERARACHLPDDEEGRAVEVEGGGCGRKRHAASIAVGAAGVI